MQNKITAQTRAAPLRKKNNATTARGHSRVLLARSPSREGCKPKTRATKTNQALALVADCQHPGLVRTHPTDCNCTVAECRAAAKGTQEAAGCCPHAVQAATSAAQTDTSHTIHHTRTRRTAALGTHACRSTQNRVTHTRRATHTQAREPVADTATHSGGRLARIKRNHSLRGDAWTEGGDAAFRRCKAAAVCPCCATQAQGEAGAARPGSARAAAPVPCRRRRLLRRLCCRDLLAAARPPHPPPPWPLLPPHPRARAWRAAATPAEP